MYFIVLYHILFFCIAEIDQSFLLRALYIPLHVAVLCFVLISGYFNIKPSVRGVVKIFAPLIVFYLPLSLYEYLTGIGDAKSLLFFSHSPYWFIRTYFYLYLIAPLLNKYLNTASTEKRLYALIVLGFISIYMGTMQEASLHDGKNLPFFMFLYTLGDTLRHLEETTNKIKLVYLVIAWISLNILLLCAYMHTEGTMIGTVLWILSYPYCSPLLIINAVLFFLIFSKMKFTSTIVNSLGGSVFAVYIVHHQHLILYNIIHPLALKIYAYDSTPLVLLANLSIMTIVIMIISIGLDKALTPIWKLMTRKSSDIFNNLILRLENKSQ